MLHKINPAKHRSTTTPKNANEKTEEALVKPDHRRKTQSFAALRTKQPEAPRGNARTAR